MTNTALTILSPSDQLSSSPNVIPHIYNNFYVFSMITGSNCLADHFPNRASGVLDTNSTERIVMHQYLSHQQNLSFMRPNGIPPIALKRSGDNLSLPLTKLFNLSLQQHCFPTNLETSLNFHAHKTDSHHDIGNYRTINNTSPLSQLFETIARDALNAQFTTNKLLSPGQYGFQKK